jgi:hypothetical protein
MRLTFFLEGIYVSIVTTSSENILRRMGGAKRYPSSVQKFLMGIAKKHSTHSTLRKIVILNAVKNLLFSGITKSRFFGKPALRMAT